MKKFTLAAAVAAMSYASFGACADLPPETPTAPQAAVYAWQFKGKTGVGVVIKGTKDQVVSSTCSDSTTPGKGPEVIRVPGSLNINAYTYICEDECTTFEANLANPTKQQYYATKPFKSEIAPYRNVAWNTVSVAHIIGKSATQYELAGVAKFAFTGKDPAETFELTYAGFGSYVKKSGRISSVSGNFAGTQTPPRYPGKVTGITESCPPADYWTCAIDYAGAPNDPSVAYGTWSVKYNSAASKKLAKNGAYWVK